MRFLVCLNFTVDREKVCYFHVKLGYLLKQIINNYIRYFNYTSPSYAISEAIVIIKSRSYLLFIVILSFSVLMTLTMCM